MSLLRSTIGLTTIAVAVLLAQSAEQARAKEAALIKSLMTLRQAIDKYTVDQHKAPQTLHDLVTKKYLGSIPADPMTDSENDLARGDGRSGRKARIAASRVYSMCIASRMA